MSTVFKLKRSSVKGKAPTTSNIELGEIAINTNDGRLFFKTTDSSSSSAIVTLREISAGTGITQTGGELKITDTGVVSGTYGSSTKIPILSINAQGQIDSASAVTVAGVSGLAYDSDTNLLTLSTADGGSYSVKIDLNTFTDSDTTDDLPEGSTNQYFTNARVQTHLGAVTGSIIPNADSAYDLGSPTKKFRDLYLSNNSIFLGGIKIQADETNNRLVVADSVGNTQNFSYDLGQNTTDDLPEGTSNLYYDSAAVVTAARSALTTSGSALSYNPQTGTITFSEVQYSGFDSDFTQKTTSDLTEGSNQYFTNTRARGAVSGTNSGTGYGSLGYNSGTGVFTYTKVTDADIRGRFSQGSGISYNSGTGVISSSITQYTDALARGAVSVTDAGGDGSLSYDNSTGIFTYTGPSASEVRAHFSAGTGIGITNGQISTSITQYTNDDARATVSVTDAGGDGSLSYDSNTGIFTYTGPSASEVRAHISAGGDLSYSSATGVVSFTERTDAEVRGLVSVTDAGGDGSLSYVSGTGVITYTGPSASETRAHFSAGGDLSYDSSTGRFSFTKRTDQQVRNLFSTSGDLNYDSSTGQFSFTAGAVYTSTQFDSDLGTKTTDNLTEGTTNLYYDSATTQTNARNAISVTDAGGDGSLAYSASTGAITYTGPSASETRAHFSGGTGVTITNGSVAIGQSVGTTDDVTFGKVSVDSASVAKQITFTPVDGFPSGSQVGGELFFDSDPSKALSFTTKNLQMVSDVTINIGQEEVIHVMNKTGATLTNGTVVELTSTDSASGTPLVKKTNATSKIKKAIGVCTQDIPDMGSGYITTQGVVRDVNTGYPFTEGDTLFICMTNPGTYVRHDISADSGYPYQLGTVLKSDSSAGSILVAPVRRHWDGGRFSGSVVIDDQLTTSGDVTARSIKFDGTVPTYSEGEVFYDSANGALAFKNEVSDITMQIGQEHWIRVYNNSGTTIANGTPVYVTGANNNFPTIAKASATADSTVHAVGLTTHAISNGQYGYVTYRGVVNDVDTSSFSAGDKVHVGTTAGTFSTVAPTYPNFAVDLGYVLTADSAGAGGSILVDVIDHVFEVVRTTGDARMDGDLTVAGNLTILGTETKNAVATLSVADQFVTMNDGDTVTAVFGAGLTGLNDLTFKGTYEGDSDKYIFVKVTNTHGYGDDIQWGFDSANGIGEFTALTFDSSGGTGPLTHNLGDDRTLVSLDPDLAISVTFDASTGHTQGNYWKGSASPTNLDFGFFGNYNKPDLPFTYAGLYRDASDSRFKFVERYDLDPTTGDINTSQGNFSLGEVNATRFHGALTGDVTGNASTATTLANGRTIGISGEVSGTGVSFNGSQDITISGTTVGSGVIDNDNINASAGIADTKLATISTAGKVNNSATSAVSTNSASAIVLRDTSGNFSAGTITANLTGNVTGTVSSLSNHTSTIRGLMVAGSGINYDSASGVISTVVAGVDSSATLSLFSVDSSANTGDGSLTYNNNGVFTYKGPTASETRAHFSQGTGITISNGQISTSITQYTDALARGAVSGGNTGTGHGSLGYNSSTGAFTFTKVTDANIRSAISAGTGISISNGQISTSITQYADADARGAVSLTADNGISTLAYNSGTGAFTFHGADSADIRTVFSGGTGISINGSGVISTSITQYVDADARSSISRTNTGTGYGSIDYNSTTGVINYNKVTNANIRSAISAGTGISISNGQISTSITQYADADARGAISHTNTGSGFGSIGYNSSTGVINYNKVTTANIRNQFSAGGDLSYDSSSGQFSFNETYSTAAELLTALKTVDTNSSGLNADTLDGEQGSHYRINVYNSSGTLLN